MPSVRAGSRPPSPTRTTRRGWPSRSARERLPRHDRLGARARRPSPTTLPSGRISAFAPGLADVGRSQRTTVARANASARSGGAPRPGPGGHSSILALTSARHSVTPWSRRIFHTFGRRDRDVDVAHARGATARRPPRWRSPAGAPTVADSPTPLAPSGWCGEGVTVLSGLPLAASPPRSAPGSP